MTLPIRRSYTGGAAACTLSSTINSSATSFSISGTTTGWPATAGGGFYMVIDPGLSTEEKVFVGSRSSGSLSSVTRGVDGTLAASHDAGATCYPVFTAVDADEANQLASTMTTKGDLVSTDGLDPKRVAVGTNNQRLVADSAQTAGLKWVADTQNTVIDAKGDLLVGSAADTTARLVVGTNNQILVADSAATNGIKWAGLSGLTGGWTSYTPSLDQSGAVTKTVTYAKYIQIDKLCICNVRLDVTGTGTTNNAVTIGLPLTSAGGAGLRIGIGNFYDASTAIGYNGAIQVNTTTTVCIFPDGANNFIGVTPNIALGASDQLTLSLMYEVA
jgi:hypothetical protein